MPKIIFISLSETVLVLKTSNKYKKTATKIDKMVSTEKGIYKDKKRYKNAAVPIEADEHKSGIISVLKVPGKSPTYFITNMIFIVEAVK